MVSACLQNLSLFLIPQEIDRDSTHPYPVPRHTPPVPSPPRLDGTAVSLYFSVCLGSLIYFRVPLLNGATVAVKQIKAARTAVRVGFVAQSGAMVIREVGTRRTHQTLGPYTTPRYCS